MRTLLPLVLLGTVACGGAGARADSASDSAAPIPVTAMKIVFQASQRALTIQVDLDGKIVGPSGREMARIVGGHIVGEGGKEIVTVAPDGAVAIVGDPELLHFSSTDDLVSSTGVLRVQANGTVVGVRNDGSADPLPARVEPFTAKGRRAAVLLVAMMLVHRQHRAAASESGPSGEP